MNLSMSCGATPPKCRWSSTPGSTASSSTAGRKEQIILGEVQHYLRVRTNPIFFGHMAINAVSAKEYR